MNLIARYLFREVAMTAGFVFVALVLLFFFFDLAGELDSIGHADYGFAQALLYVVLNVPGHVYEMVPIAALIGALFVLSRLVMNSEFTVMLASGVSSWRIAMLLALVGVGFAVTALLVGELVSPWSEQAAKKLKLRATESVVAQSFRSGLWVKDGNAFINAREVLPDSSLRDLRVYEFDKDWELARIMTAEQGRWEGKNRWKLANVSDTRFSGQGIVVSHHENLGWESVLGPDILSVLLVAPEKMSTPALVNYIGYLRENKQQTARYEVALWSKMFYLLAIPAIMLLALPFAFHSPRSGGMALKVFLGILAGLAFHLGNRLFSHIGLLNGWPPFITAATPSLLFLALALIVLKRLEKR